MQLDDFGEDIVRRCRWAITHNDGRANGAWSTGEKLAVALVLGDKQTLDEMEYTKRQAVQRVKGGMWRPPRDFNAWLNIIRAELDKEG